MDQVRQIRLLVPPFILGLSLAAGLYFSECDFLRILESRGMEVVVALGALIGAAILPAGFVISSLSILGLHVFFFCFVRCQTYEVKFPEETWNRIWPLLRTHLPRATKWNLYAGVTFDHELLPMGIHEWLLRRWSSFNISVHSMTAILLSHIAALHPDVDETWPWQLITVIFLIVFASTACIAWCQTMRMLEFQATREACVFQSPANHPNERANAAGI